MLALYTGRVGDARSAIEGRSQVPLLPSGRPRPMRWHLMLTIGIVMMMIFAHLYFSPYRRLGRALAAADWPGAGAALNQIRKMVGINLALGTVNIAIASLGAYLSH